MQRQFLLLLNNNTIYPIRCDMKILNHCIDHLPQNIKKRIRECWRISEGLTFLEFYLGRQTDKIIGKKIEIKILN